MSGTKRYSDLSSATPVPGALTSATLPARYTLSNPATPILIADQVRAADVNVNPLRRVKAAHLPTIVCRPQHHVRRYNPIAQDMTIMVNVKQEQVDRLDALAQTSL